MKPLLLSTLGASGNFERRLAGTCGVPYPATCRLSSCLLLGAPGGAGFALVVDELLRVGVEALLAAAARLPNLCRDVHSDLGERRAVALVVSQ